MAEPSIWYLSVARVQVDSRKWLVNSGWWLGKIGSRFEARGTGFREGYSMRRKDREVLGDENIAKIIPRESEVIPVLID